MFFQRKLPVSLSSCITLSVGEIITVASSISLHANAGFFCQETEGFNVMRGEPPKTPRPYERPIRNRASLPQPGRRSPGDAGLLWIPKRRKARLVKERES